MPYGGENLSASDVALLTGNNGKTTVLATTEIGLGLLSYS